MIVKGIKTWHRTVCSRDNYICQLQLSPDCKKDYSFPIYLDENGENNYVCGDHLKPRNVAPELKLETTNGKCVCKPCHALRDYKELPEGYLEPVEETISEALTDEQVTEKMLKISNSIPRNQPLRGILATYNKIICNKCGKHEAMESGLCLQCQPFRGHQLKIKKSNKK